jgi:hypothetical protein
MDGDRLSEIQRRILIALSKLTPPWTLVGGAALVGFHLGHRTTRDLDLFFRPMSGLGELATEARSILENQGFDIAEVNKTHSFVRFRVSFRDEVTIVDLVSEPAEPPRPPEEAILGDVTVRVASRIELLATKLCTLLNRAEVRDLVDVRALLDLGMDLGEALSIAPRVDTGFSPLTLAWVLRDLDVRKLAEASGEAAGEAAELAEFKGRLVDDLVALSRPE